MRLVQFTHMGVPIWTNPELVLWVQSKGGGTRICLGAGGTSRERGEVLTLTEPIEEVVRALAADPALEREHERLSLALDTAGARMREAWEEVTVAPRSGEDTRWLREAERDLHYASVELEAFLAAYPQFNEQAQS